MRLRLILAMLCVLSVSSALVGGHLYYGALKRAAFNEAERQALVRVENLREQITAFISENRRSAQTLARMDAVVDFLQKPHPALLGQVHGLLDRFQESLGVEVCYLMDHTGLTVAASNRDAPDSFLGQNFSFRPYFKDTMTGGGANYLAMGVTSKRRGVYHSFPILNPADGFPMGVVVIKASVEQVERDLHLGNGEDFMVVAPQGITFISSRKEWLFKTLYPLTPDDVQAVASSRQFGPGPWPWTGIRIEGAEGFVDAENQRFKIYSRSLEGYAGWNVIYLLNPDAVIATVYKPLLHFTGPVVMAICLLVGGTVFWLYRKAIREIRMRQDAEDALRSSDERYRSLYHHTPAMLHSVDPNGFLVSVSEHWAETLGYRPEEAIGHRITDFMTEASRRFAEEEIMPAFFKTGFCKDIPYSFVSKTGREIDVALSAIAERDRLGRIVRSLAVSIDVTELKRAQVALEQAKEQLDRYSKDLERLVDQRTEQLRRLSGGILSRQEKERAAIARELHDELGQVLTALRMDAVWLSERLKPSDPSAAGRALTMVSLIDKNIKDVRGLAMRLRPGVLDDLGLVEALEWTAADFERRTGIVCIFDRGPIPEVGDDVATAAYRITQEALTNAARHGHAQQVTIRLRMNEAGLTLKVTDNGCGFNPEDYKSSEGFGMVGMEERAALVRGSLKVTSAPGTGTEVVFSVPLKELAP